MSNNKRQLLRLLLLEISRENGLEQLERVGEVI